ncbi:unnamed protein product [Hermetia illucens]|uniref:Uncharacterized protein n=1 Tax=Hermetia illucens TaxID=343691 RepID=A0A7R8YP11_HERIL|nr:uncharacterized protein LOC119646572 [Hermetia illucens]CAD7079831.1 unnamed protein product [Hermetia illucens]
MNKVCAVLVILNLFSIGTTFACNGYNLTIVESTPCPGSPELVTLSKDFGLKLTKDCYLVFTGCVSNKPFKTAEMQYAVSRGSQLIVEQTLDMCAYNFLDRKCPMPEGKYCFSNSDRHNIKSLKRILHTFVGNYDVVYNIAHDGESSCGTLKLKFGKK